MREKFLRFMLGRYGVDFYSRCMLWTGIVCLVLSLWWSVLCWFAYGLFIYCYMRALSKNIYKRAQENQRFLRRTEKLRIFFFGRIKRMREWRKFHIYRCPNCRQKIRIPRGKGRISVTCPRCHIEFLKKS